MFSFGKTIHNTLYEFLKQYQEMTNKKQNGLFGAATEGYAMSEADLLKIYDEQWLDEWFDSKKQKDDYYKKGKRMIRDFYAKFLQNPPCILNYQGESALEIDFKIKIGEYIIKGKIDRIDEADGGARLIDYKTGKKESEEKLKKDEKTQLLLYQIAAEEFLGLKPVGLCYYYLDNGETFTFLGAEKEKADLKAKVIEQIEKIKQSDFTATPGWHCQTCDFKSICEFSCNK